MLQAEPDSNDFIDILWKFSFYSKTNINNFVGIINFEKESQTKVNSV